MLPSARLVSPAPRVLSYPPSVSSAGEEAVELAASAGLVLDPAQQLVLRHALAEKPGGKWAAFEVGVVQSRQNGKGAIIEARELAGLFLLGERMIVHTAHQFDTALEAFRRVLELIESTPDLDSRVQRVTRSHGEEGVELRSGQRLRFKARTSGGGRGFSGDCVILDEAMVLPETAIRALMFTLSARPNPQLWYLGSAVDKLEHEHGRVFSRIRARGVAGGDPSLVFAEWSATEDDDPDDPEVQARVNPGVAAGRITLEHIATERRSMSDRGFRIERLSAGDWFTDDDRSDAGAFPADVWKSLADPSAERGESVSFGLATAPDRSWSAIAVAWWRPDGLAQVMVSDYRPSTDWVAGRAKDLVARWGGAVRVDVASRSLLDQAVALSQPEQAMAQAALRDMVAAGKLRHGNQVELNVAVRAARWRTSGDTQVLDRRSGADISPLAAAALALHGLTAAPSLYEDRELVVL